MLLEYKKIKNIKGFTLIETVAATGILATFILGIWVVIDRCVNSTADTTMKIQAFEIARNNMESLLSQNSVKEHVEYGTSEKYPYIDWQTKVETFYEPISSQMWLRGICTATFYDSSSEEQSVELEHWITGLSKEQLLEILTLQEDEGQIQDSFETQLIESVEDAALYAGVSEETIEEWLNKGMLTTEDGFFIKNNLDLFSLNQGEPDTEDIKNNQLESQEDFRKLTINQNRQALQNEIDPKTGLSYGEMEDMDITEIWNILKQQ